MKTQSPSCIHKRDFATDEKSTDDESIENLNEQFLTGVNP